MGCIVHNACWSRRDSWGGTKHSTDCAARTVRGLWFVVDARGFGAEELTEHAYSGGDRPGNSSINSP